MRKTESVYRRHSGVLNSLRVEVLPQILPENDPHPNHYLPLLGALFLMVQCDTWVCIVNNSKSGCNKKIKNKKES